MAQVKLTKNALRDRHKKLLQFRKYLPILQLKKVLLQTEVNRALYEWKNLHLDHSKKIEENRGFQSLLTDPDAFYLFRAIGEKRVKKRYENIAGVDVPLFAGIDFAPIPYSLFDTPLWLDRALTLIQELIATREKIRIAEEKRGILERELHTISIRVNLLEKVLIPRTEKEIKKIKVGLGDQELTAVVQAKFAKAKILKKTGEKP